MLVYRLLRHPVHFHLTLALFIDFDVDPGQTLLVEEDLADSVLGSKSNSSPAHNVPELEDALFFFYSLQEDFRV